MKSTVRLSIPQDADELQGRLREADLRELEALGTAPRSALHAGLEHPQFCYTVLAEDEVVAMFGVAPMVGNPSIGVPWLLSDDKFLKLFSFRFLRRCMTYVNRMNDLYPTLVNWVDARNESAIRWLYWCGFKFLNAIPPPNYPVGLFIPFVRYKTHV